MLCVTDGADTLVEAEVHDDGRAVATLVCSVRIGAGGLIERYLAFACRGARDPLPDEVVDEPADAATVVHDYFTLLDTGDFTGAAAQFSTDVLYSHPPYRHTGIDDPDRIEFRGRAELEAAFHRRGRASFDHDIVALIQRGPHCVFEGAVNNLPNGGFRQLHLQPVPRRRRHHPPLPQLLLRTLHPPPLTAHGGAFVSRR